MSTQQAQTKKFQKGERVIPAADQQASKYYPAEDEAQPKKVRSQRMEKEICGKRWTPTN